MITVRLEVIDPHKGLVRAPLHCPFKRTLVLDDYPNVSPDDQGDIMAIQTSICGVCGVCKFNVSSTPVDDDLSLEAARQLVQRAILANQLILSSITKQILYLQKKDRSALVVLLSFAALQTIMFEAGYEHGDLALNRVVASEGPICMVSGVPLYFSQLLTRSPVQVVGEVEWV